MTNDLNSATPQNLDVSSALRSAENALRDLIQELLKKRFGDDWEDSCGLTEERIAKWKERRLEEGARLSTGNLESRLLYFADFTDLKLIVSKYWDSQFKEVFGEKREFDVLVSKLEDFRNPDAHRRGLSEFQVHLALGISGELRTQIARYRSKRETADDCFPRIESVFDNYGSTYPDNGSGKRPRLRVGDRIEITANAIDPEDLQLEYEFTVQGGSQRSCTGWIAANQFSLELQEGHISRCLTISICIRSMRSFHASYGWDDLTDFSYEVLPNRSTDRF